MEPATAFGLAALCGAVFMFVFGSNKSKSKKERDIEMATRMQIGLNAIALGILNDKIDKLLEERGINYEMPDLAKLGIKDRDCAPGCSCDSESKPVQ
jgi:hypothetical protein